MMFLFKSNNEIPKESVNIDENFENVVVESIYVIFVNDEPSFFGKDKIETFKKIEEIVNHYKFQLLLKNYIPTVEYDYNNMCVKIYSRTTNNIINYDKREYTITWKKVKNDN